MFPFVTTATPEDDNKAFMDEMYRTHFHLMYVMARKYVKSDYDAEEIISDASLSLIKSVGTLRNLEEPQLQAYIIATIRTKAYDYYDRMNAKKRSHTSLDAIEFGISDKTADIERHILLQEELDIVMAAIDRLPTKEREVLLLKYQHDMDYRLIGQQVGLSDASVHKYLSRARSKIKAMVYGKEYQE